MQKNRTQRKLPSGGPPVVTYSRRRDEEIPDVYDDGRAEPRFDDEPVAEWEAVEVPPEPPLHARRRARPLVEPVRSPVDEADFDRPAQKAKPKRSTAMRLVAVVAVAAIAIGVAILVFAFSNSSTVTVSAPALNEDGAEPGTVPADDAGGGSTTAVREIPLTGEGAVAAPPVPASTGSASTAPAEPPAPRARPEPPASAATAVAPDFDQAAPLPPAEAAPAVPQTATAPANSAADDDFIARIERTLAESDGAPAPLSPSSQPIQLAPQATQPGVLVPPEDIPMVDGQGQPVTLPSDFLLLDTE